ncbi:MAG: YaiI/YqxD family protein, partial [Treponema sp.]|nr:YaiI/YqxD family protein [Treponema sp.]
MTIFVDADSCPRPARELVIRTVKRRPLRAVFAANRPLPLETGPEIVMELCPPGEGSVDNRIVELAR